MESKIPAIDTLLLTCPETAPEPEELCNALELALLNATQVRNFRRIEYPTTPIAGEFVVSFRVTQSGPSLLEGYLEWQSHGAAAQQGPVVTLSVEDATLDTSLYGRFAASLIEISDMPIALGKL
ncbi:MAG: hypothetical protein ACC631_09515 [Halocynthiibacter sp.]